MNARISKISKALLDISQCADVVLRLTNSGEIAMRGKGISNAERCLLERIDGFRSLEQILAISGDVIGLHATMGKLLALGMVVPEGDPEPQAVAAPAPARAVAKAPPPPPMKPTAAKVSPPVAPAPQQAKAAPRQMAPATAKAPPAASAKPVSTPAKAAGPAQPKATPPAKPVAAVTQKEQGELAQAKALLHVEASYLFSGDKAKQLIARIDACKNTAEIYDFIVKLQGLLAKTGKANPDVFLERLTSGLAKIRESQKAATAGRPAK